MTTLEPLLPIKDPATDIITLDILQPDDWHIHLRDGDALARTVPDAAHSFKRVMCMPNLVPPVKTVSDALAYRQRILDHVPAQLDFEPYMALYLTEQTTPQDIIEAAQTQYVKAVKLYPAGATTNSSAGVHQLSYVYPVIAEMEAQGIPFLLHGEVTHQDVDIFDREKRFLDEVLAPLLQKFPRLRIVLEHITTADAAQFVLAQPDHVAATITPQHLMFNRNDLFKGGMRPHLFCLPILKRRVHQEKLLEVATSGNPKFFLGTDSAPHTQDRKEAACGCAGCYSSPLALALYAEMFESVGKLNQLEAFSSVYGAQFYGLKPNTRKVRLIKAPFAVPAAYPYLNGQLVPLLAGETLAWRMEPLASTAG